MLRVESIQGELTRFYVFSETKPGRKYLCDLLEFDGNGKCDCDHFKFRLEPVLFRGYRETSLLCKHLKSAREAWATMVLRHMAKTESEPVIRHATRKQ